MLSLARSLSLRPLAVFALGLATGLLVGRSLPGLPAAALAGAGLGLFVAALGALSRRRLAMAGLAMALAGLSAGLARVQSFAARLAGPGLPRASGLHLRAVVVEDLGPRFETGRHSFIVQPLSLDGLRKQRVPDLAGRLRLSTDLEAGEELGPGDEIEVWGNLRGLEPPTNPGEFDYRAYALGQGVTASFSARQDWPVRLLRPGSPWQPRRAAWRLKTWLDQGLRTALSIRSADLAAGLALGDKSGLSREDVADFARAGLADILAVSGAHFAVVLGLCLLAFARLTWSRRWQAALGLAAGLAYALATGFEAPVQRAFGLFAITLVGRILDLEADWGASLALAAVAILLAQPGALFEPGFQLSLAAAWAVLVPGPALAARLPAKWPGWLRQGLGVYLCAQWVVVGLLAWHFHCFQWVGLLTPLLTAPAAPLLLGGALLLAPLAHGPEWTWATLAGLVERGYGAFDAFGSWASTLPHSAFSTGTPRLWLITAWLALPLLLLVLRRRLAFAGLAAGAAALAAALLWPGLAIAHRHPGLTKVWVLDVGQGDAVLTEFEDGRTLLVDAGTSRPDMGAWVLGPALRGLGLQGLDWAVATHPHADHVGGYFWLLKQFPVGLLAHSGQRGRGAWPAVRHLAEARGVPLLDLYLNAAPADWDGRLRLLSPRSPLAKSKKRVHDRGVVLELESWLQLPGDLETEGEAHLLAQGLLRPVEVLKAPHHGSRSSSSRPYLRALRPAHTVISCGRGNLYHHPNALALERLRPIQLWRTDLQGCLLIEKRRGEKAVFRPWRPATGPLDQPPPKQKRFRWKGLRMPEA